MSTSDRGKTGVSETAARVGCRWGELHQGHPIYEWKKGDSSSKDTIWEGKGKEVPIGVSIVLYVAGAKKRPRQVLQIIGHTVSELLL